VKENGGVLDIFESKICPVTGYDLVTKKEWKVKHLEYTCKYGIIAQSIIIVEPGGNSVLETFYLFSEMLEKVISTYPKTNKFVLIDNYTNFKRASHKARKEYIKYFNNHKKIAMVVYMGLPKTLHILVNVGITINYTKFPIKITKTYYEAISESIIQLERLNAKNEILQKYSFQNNKLENKSEMLLDKNDLQEIIKNEIVISYIDKFNKFLKKINWYEYDESLHLIPNIKEEHPLNVLIETLSLIKFDITQLIMDFTNQEKKLIKAKDDLKKLNTNLETLVKKRTQELKRVNKELKVAKEEAELANKGKAVFLASISHELKTPLNSIMGYSSLGLSKLETIPKEKIGDYLTQINSSGRRLLNLIVDLIDTTKFEAGEMSFHFTENNIWDIAKKAVSEISSLSEAKNINIILNNEVEEVNFIFDSSRILQVFINILSNAIKFTPKNKEIHIDLKDTLHEFICSIKDDGAGIEENELELIFDTFKMGRKSDYSCGTGLGLAISKNIVTAHKGKIWAENDKTGGAVITFIISKDLKAN